MGRPLVDDLLAVLEAPEPPAVLLGLLTEEGYQVETIPGGCIATPTDTPPAPVLWHHHVPATGTPEVGRDGDEVRAVGAASVWGPLVSAMHAKTTARLAFTWSDPELGTSLPAALLENTQAVLLGGGVWPGPRPAAVVGGRGVLEVSLRLSSGPSALEPGDVGGLAPNALGELAELVVSLDRPEERPRLDEEAVDMTIAEAQHFALSGFDLQAMAEREGLRRLRFDDPLEAMETLWARPGLELLDLRPTGSGFPTQAEATVCVHLVPHMRARRVMDVLAHHVRSRGPHVELSLRRAIEPWLTRLRNPLADAVREAYRAAFGARAALVRDARPHPLAARFAARNIPTVGLPTARREQRTAGGRERVHRSDLEAGAGTGAALVSAWSELLAES